MQAEPKACKVQLSKMSDGELRVKMEETRLKLRKQYEEKAATRSRSKRTAYNHEADKAGTKKSIGTKVNGSISSEKQAKKKVNPRKNYKQDKDDGKKRMTLKELRRYLFIRCQSTCVAMMPINASSATPYNINDA